MTASTACKRGHQRIPANQMLVRHPNGKVYPRCLSCHNLRSRLRYRKDANFMLAERARCLANYYRRKEASQ